MVDQKLVATSKDARDGRTIFKKAKSDPSDGDPDDSPINTFVGTNIAFTNSGLNKASSNASNDLQDASFSQGMNIAKAESLGDSFADWQRPFSGSGIDSLILIAGASDSANVKRENDVKEVLGIGEDTGKDGATARFLHRIVGRIRPGDNRGFEHFGFCDGISQPAIEGVKDVKGVNGLASKDLKAPPLVNLGKFLLGRPGDITSRPTWAVDGSFLCFRHLFQKVPEFKKFLKDATAGSAEELLGAKLVGRWKSGAPLDLSSSQDDPTKALSNLFTYHDGKEPISGNRCPLGAHTRKTNPRGDLSFKSLEAAPMIRRSIPFGPELSTDEIKKETTSQDRGLLFVSYQSSLGNAFETITNFWVNSPTFPVEGSGIDPFSS